MEKGVLFVGILVLGFIVFVMGLLIFAVYKNTKINNDVCLKEIAKDYCADNFMFFDDVFWDTSYKFSCKKNLRAIGYVRISVFNFLNEEIEKCKT
jgi:hypothetical protein